MAASKLSACGNGGGSSARLDRLDSRDLASAQESDPFCVETITVLFEEPAFVSHPGRIPAPIPLSKPPLLVLSITRRMALPSGCRPAVKERPVQLHRRAFAKLLDEAL